ncbi:hypothetical protein HHK36_025242 [Tetracentron sinense]|uniref:GRAM domain-containing protein n=1 Tax=Tetracentron sinense TaxID=13715 RepID=A0A834YMN5_TETSI|nr:hypothetical protein HHK36_025242 [Tetracentron sinense]
MTGSTKETQPPPSSPITEETKESPHQPSSPITDETKEEPHQPSSSSAPPPPSDEGVAAEKWGTHIMGPPAVPTAHPDNKKAALWSAGDQQQQYHHHPYLHCSPVDKPSTNPLEPVLNVFNSWGKKAETMGRNIWQNLKTGSSLSGAAWGKVNLTFKAMTEGGYESLYKQTFTILPEEKLKRTFACYLSTSTGPVAGTLYLSNAHVAFCSDRPLSFTAPSGQEAWSYYKVMVPLGMIGTVNPVVMRDNSSEKYIQIVTIDGHDFWFMGFVNYDKASRHLCDSMSEFTTSQKAVQPVVG